mgnify:CR=1 FL=1
MFLKCRYYHTFHYLVDADIEKSVVKFLRGCDNTFRLHILKQLEQLDIRHRRNEERPIDGAVLSKKHRDKDRRMCDSHENFCERHKN